MPKYKAADKKLLDKLVSDCIIYQLKPTDALRYIEVEFGRKVSIASYWNRRSRLSSEASTNSWHNDYARIGFAQDHRKCLDIAHRLLDYSVQQRWFETIKENADQRLIFTFNNDVRENLRVLGELMEASPVIASIKAKIQAGEQVTNKEGNGQVTSAVSEGVSATDNPDPWV